MSDESQQTWGPASGPRMAWDDAKADRAMQMEIERNDARRERDEWKASCALYHTANASLDADRSALLAAIRNLRDAKGRHNSGTAYARLLALLPENDQAIQRSGGITNKSTGT